MDMLNVSKGTSFLEKNDRDLFKSRESLVGLILIMDIRRNWANEESQLLDWLDRGRLSRSNIMIVLNKSDKVSKHIQKKQIKEIQTDSNVNDVFVISCRKKAGLFDLQKYIFKKFRVITT